MLDQIRIYVACLSSYSEGVLYRKWIDATQEADDIYSDVQAMLAASSQRIAEEWAIHDYEGFEGVSISESEDFETVSQLANFVLEHGKLGGLLLDYCDNDLERANQAIHEGYCGVYASLEDYVMSIHEDIGDVPDHLIHYIDYKKMGRDMELNSEIFTIETSYQEIHVFHEF